jgi:hypothetical protein
VDAARIRYLTVSEAKRLINGCGPDFKPLVQAALQTGARYGELIRLEVHDFNPDAGTLAVRQSKSGKPRHIVLTDEGVALFRELSAGRNGNEPLIRRANGLPFRRNDQALPMMEAVKRAKITPPISFHGLRHTWASLAVMNGVPPMVGRKEPRPSRYPHGREALRPLGSVLHCRGDPRRRPALWLSARQENCRFDERVAMTAPFRFSEDDWKKISEPLQDHLGLIVQDYYYVPVRHLLEDVIDHWLLSDDIVWKRNAAACGEILEAIENLRATKESDVGRRLIDSQLSESLDALEKGCRGFLENEERWLIKRNGRRDQLIVSLLVVWKAKGGKAKT